MRCATSCAYAASRHVQIVPEIDMPGHATAAIAAYPWLGVAGAVARAPTPAVSARWGVHHPLFNLEPRTLRFLEDVFAEVMRAFPRSRSFTSAAMKWSRTSGTHRPRCRRARAQLGFTDPRRCKRISRGQSAAIWRRATAGMAGWDEILQPDLRKDAIVMSWHGVSGAHAAALAGNDTVLAPDPMMYFDHRQSTLPTEPPGRLSVLSLEDVYRFESYDATLSNEQRRHVLGIQANLWTEHMQTEARVQWMALPRAAALAEIGWSPVARRGWPDFLERLVPMLARYQAFGLNYADSVFAPAAQVARNAAGFSLTLSNQAGSGGDASEIFASLLMGKIPRPIRAAIKRS